MNDAKTQKKWARIQITSGRYDAEAMGKLANAAEDRGDIIAAAELRKAATAAERPATSISVLGKIVRTTEKAILFSALVGDYVGEAWFPKSVVRTFDGDQHGLTRLTAPAAMIREKLNPNTKE